MNRITQIFLDRKRFFVWPVTVILTVFIAIGAWLFRGGFQRWETTPFHAPTPTRIYKNWDDVFAHPGPITLQTLTTGTISADRAMNLDPNNPKSRQLQGNHEPLPALAQWLHHATYGDILVDSGFGRDFHRDPPYGNYSDVMSLFNRAMGVRNSQLPGEDLVSQLAALNVRPHTVFITHLHPDHTAGAADLPNDIDYVFGERENWFLARAFTGDHFLGKKSHLRTLRFTQATAMPPFDAVIDLLGDGSLWAISTPGHTRDHISFLANAMDHPILITGDAVHFAWEFENDVAPFGLTKDDTRDAQRSLDQIIEFKTRYPRVELKFGHGE